MTLLGADLDKVSASLSDLDLGAFAEALQPRFFVTREAGFDGLIVRATAHLSGIDFYTRREVSGLRLYQTPPAEHFELIADAARQAYRDLVWGGDA